MLVVALIATIVRRGLFETSESLHWEFGVIVILGALLIVGSTLLRFQWNLAKREFFWDHRSLLISAVLWFVGLLGILILAPMLANGDASRFSRPELALNLSELFLVLRSLIAVATVTRRASADGVNPVVLLVVSFVVLIGVGTLLLMMPQARSHQANARQDESFAQRLQTAAFTSTSASCVTGLVVESTGGAEPYWSRLGQTVIMCLFQIGGLGIMTCGAFFAVAAGRQLEVRESVALQSLLESNALGDVRRLLTAILVFTLLSELLGAVAISGLWADLPWGERVYYSLFHSISAFCNAGFTLTDDSFVSFRDRPEVWGGVTTLIIVGGLGFAALYNLGLVVRSRFKALTQTPLFDLPRDRVRLTLSTRIVCVSTLALLVCGTLGYFLLESTAPRSADAPLPQTLFERGNEAWFQSVTMRTAGFNTVDNGRLQPATKLFASLLMFIGASPGSTGGGVKTVVFAVTLLALFSILRGRNRVEFFGRTIPTMQVNRAMAILTLGVGTLMVTTLLLAVYENQPGRFLDYLFEATSACATVGVSTSTEIDGQLISTTQSLSFPSRNVIIVAMFLGRVGPLTMLMALAGRDQAARYDYPPERITLG